MKLKSSAFQHEGEIPRKYTCQGDEVNPPLEIQNVPAGAKSLVLIVEDPDVPEWVNKEKIWDHWVVYNISPSLKKIEENTKPFATFGKNTSGKNKYDPMCPPDREHRYFFKLYALDEELNLPEGLTKKAVLKAIEGHILTETELMGTYVKT
jgi:Raf kinase inhibitor-like YbhB/YbcL family protein